MKIFYIALILLLSLINSYANNTDTSAIIYGAKVQAYVMQTGKISSLDLLKPELHTMSYEILKTSGFDSDIIFIKLKVRPRSRLVWALALNAASKDEERIMTGADTRSLILDVDSLAKIILDRVYTFNDSTSNDILESKLDTSDNYFQDREYCSCFNDYYYAYSIRLNEYFLIKIGSKSYPLNNEFRNLIYDADFSIFDGDAYTLMKRKKYKEETRLPLPVELFQYISIEELGTGFLKKLPPYKEVFHKVSY